MRPEPDAEISALGFNADEIVECKVELADATCAAPMAEERSNLCRP